MFGFTLDSSENLFISIVAKKRLEKFGKNELEEPPPIPLWRRMIDQFANLLIIALLIGTVISFVAGEYVQASVILVVLVLNAVLGVVQEGRSESALNSLLALSSDSCTILREGKELKIPVEEVAWGDVLILIAGDKIGADCVLIQGEGSVSEIVLTGESIDINKSLPNEFDNPPDALDTINESKQEEDDAKLVEMGSMSSRNDPQEDADAVDTALEQNNGIPQIHDEGST